MAGDNVTVGLAFLAGLLSFISPCVLPLMPAYISYMGARVTRQAAAELAITPSGTPSAVPNAVTRSGLYRIGLMLHGIMFVAGFTLVFVGFGLAVNAGLKLLGVSSYTLQTTLAQAGGVIVILFGLHVLGVTGWLLRQLIRRVSPESGIARLLNRIQGILYADTRRQLNPRNPYGYGGSVLMGAVFAAGWTPCVGPIYGSILILASNGQTNSAALMLTAYSLGLGLPFLLTALALDRVRSLLKRLQRQMRTIEIVSGLFLIAIGFLLATNQLAELSASLTGLNNFSYNLEGCGTDLVQGTILPGSFGGCLQDGPPQTLPTAQPTSLLPTATGLPGSPPPVVARGWDSS